MYARYLLGFLAAAAMGFSVFLVQGGSSRDTFLAAFVDFNASSPGSCANLGEYCEYQGCCDGLECLESSKCGYASSAPAAACSDGVDNDGDGRVDTDDTGCDTPDDADETGDAVDLDVVKYGGQTVEWGRIVAYSVKIENMTSTVAENVRLTDPVPSGLRFDRASFAGNERNCEQTPAGVVECTVDSIGARQTVSANMIFVADVGTCGNFLVSNTVTVSADGMSAKSVQETPGPTRIVCTAPPVSSAPPTPSSAPPAPSSAPPTPSSMPKPASSASPTSTSSARPPSSASASSASSLQCVEKCTGTSLLNVLSFGLLGTPATCSLDCGVTPDSSSSATSGASSDASSTSPAGRPCCRIGGGPGTSQTVVGCTLTPTREACESFSPSTDKWLPDGDPAACVSNAAALCLLPDLAVDMDDVFGVPTVIADGESVPFDATITNEGAAPAHDVKVVFTLTEPLVADRGSEKASGATCVIDAARRTITCTASTLAAGASITVSGTVGLSADASPSLQCSALLPITASATTSDTEVSTDNNDGSRRYRYNCGVCCPNVDDSGGTCSLGPKSACGLDNPFYTPSWLPPPNTCADCPRKSSSSASSFPRKVCCLYDQGSVLKGNWDVVSCQNRTATPPRKTSCNDYGETMQVLNDSGGYDTVPVTGEWRDDIDASECSPSNAVDVCGKGEIDLTLSKTYESSGASPVVGDEIRYELTVENLFKGAPLPVPDTAVDVTVLDYRNNNLAFVRAVGAECEDQPAGLGVTCTLGNLPGGEEKTFTLVFTLLERGIATCTVSNKALVYSDNKDSNIQNNYANAGVSPDPAAFNAYCWGSSSSASSSSSSSPANSCCVRGERDANPGDLYRVANACLKNVTTKAACDAKLGTTFSTSVYTYDIIATHFTDAQSCAAGCSQFFDEVSCCSADGCSVGTTAECKEKDGTPGKGSTCDNACASSSSTASAAPKKPCCTEGQCSMKTAEACGESGGTPKEGYSCTTDLCAPKPDITVTNELVGRVPNAVNVRKPGDPAEFVVTVSNAGDKEATGVSVSDELPSYLSIVTMPTNCTNINASRIICSGISVPAYGSSSFTINMKVQEPPSVCSGNLPTGDSTALVTAPAEFDSVSNNNIGVAYGFEIPCSTKPTKYCCSTSTYGCYKEYLTADGKCPSPVDGTSETGYDTESACRSTGKCVPPSYKYCCNQTGSCSYTSLDSDGNCPAYLPSTQQKGYDSLQSCTQDPACAPQYCCSGNSCVKSGPGVSCTQGTIGSASDCSHVNPKYGCGPTPPMGACCRPGYECSQQTEEDCKKYQQADPLVKWSEGKTCEEACPTGACCTSNGCESGTDAVSCGKDGIFQAGQSCPTACQRFCCNTYYGDVGDAKSCKLTMTDVVDGAFSCIGGSAAYDTYASCDATCQGTPRGACCVEGKPCGDGQTQSECSGEWKEGLSCSSNACGAPAEKKYCCTNGNACSETAAGQCADGSEPSSQDDCAKTCGVPDPDEVWCCANTGDDEFGCAKADKETGCGIDRAPGSSIDGYATRAECEKVQQCASAPVPVNSCNADLGCYPVNGDGSCPFDPDEFAMNPSWWARLTGWVTGRPVAMLERSSEFPNCCCRQPPTGNNGGNGTNGPSSAAGSQASATSSATSSNASSVQPVPKTCGTCDGLPEQQCVNGPHYCTWQASPFGFLSILFGGYGGTCSPDPAYCKAAGSSSSATPQSSSSSSSSSSPQPGDLNLTLVILGLRAQPACGDLRIQDGEQCEPRIIDAEGRACTSRCRWTACSDGIDNDGDGFVDRADGGCHSSGKAPAALFTSAGRYLAQFFFDDPQDDFLPARDTESCPMGMTPGVFGDCDPLPACPAPETSANGTSLFLYCGNACAGRTDPEHCASACRVACGR